MTKAYAGNASPEVATANAGIAVGAAAVAVGAIAVGLLALSGSGEGLEGGVSRVAGIERGRGRSALLAQSARAHPWRVATDAPERGFPPH